MSSMVIAAVRLYRRTIGLAFAGRCKYHPSCSQYAIDAFASYGVLRGIVLSLWRLARCNPWSHGGVDYVRDQRLFHAHPHEPEHRPASSP